MQIIPTKWRQLKQQRNKSSRPTRHLARLRYPEPLEPRNLLTIVPIVAETTQAKVLVPTQPQFDNLARLWTNNPFNDSAWLPTSGPNGVGFEALADSDYAEYIGRNIRSIMRSISPTAFVRIPFTANDVDRFEKLTLNLRFDDGFIAWLNGVEVARYQAHTGYPTRDTKAFGSHSGLELVSFDISDDIGALLEGNNVLALRGFNFLASDSTFLIQASLDGEFTDIAPTAVDDNASMYVDDSPVIVDVVANDISGTSPINSSSVVIVTQPQQGTASIGAIPGTVVYTPLPGFSGIDAFSYQVNDGILNSNVGTVLVNVQPLPIASRDDFYVLNEDQPLNVTTDRSVIANDIDLEGDMLTATLVDGPRHGSISFQPSGEFRYAPDANYYGNDSFTYFATDGDNDSRLATVNLSISPVNDSPTAIDDVYKLRSGGTLTASSLGSFSYATVVSNDSPRAFWRLAESEGQLADEVTGEHVGFYGGTPVFGQQSAVGDEPDTSVRFNGATDSITAPFESELNPFGSFSIEAWVKVSSETDIARAIVTSQSTTAQGFAGFALRLQEDSDWAFVLGSGSNWTETSSFGWRPEIGEWTHVVATFDANRIDTESARGTLRLYVNGVATVSRANAIYVPSTSSDFRIGAGGTFPSVNSPFEGWLDEIALYGRALSAEQVVRHYRTGVGKLADSVADFSGVQGANGWSFGYYDKSSDADGQYGREDYSPFPSSGDEWGPSQFWNEDRFQWINPDLNVKIGDESVLPAASAAGGALWPVRRWQSDYSGPVSVEWSIGKEGASSSSNGVTARVFLNGALIDSAVISGTNVDGVKRQLLLEWVTTGDMLDFALDPIGIDGIEDAESDAAAFVISIRPTREASTLAIPGMSSWKYLDSLVNGSPYPSDDSGHSWVDPSFEDSTWQTGDGILGYGIVLAGPIATTIEYGGNAADKYRTSLFRRTFNLYDIDRIRAIELLLLVEDGGAVYINGREVIRYYLPGVVGDGTLTSDTLALPNGTEQYQWHELELADFPGLLVEGVNTIAVEVHQVSGDSSDLGFDVWLTANHISIPNLNEPGVTANDVDVDRDTLAAQVIAGPQNGILDLKPDGTFTYQPNSGFFGVDYFSYQLSDGEELSMPAEVTLVVAPPEKRREDLNADGTVGVEDIAFLMRRFGTLQEARLIEGDMNSDGSISLFDAIKLRNKFEAPPLQAAAMKIRVEGLGQASRPQGNTISARRRNDSPSHVAVDLVVRGFDAATQVLRGNRSRTARLLSEARDPTPPLPPPPSSPSPESPFARFLARRRSG